MKTLDIVLQSRLHSLVCRGGMLPNRVGTVSQDDINLLRGAGLVEKTEGWRDNGSFGPMWRATTVGRAILKNRGRR